MYFSDKMTYPEALQTLFSVVEGKSKDEIEKIKEEYKAVIPSITRKELHDNQGCLTSYQFKKA